MQKNHIIRLATENDLQSIVHLGEMLQNDSQQFEPDLLFNSDTSLEHYNSELSNENALIIVAVDSDEIVGYQYSFISTLDYLIKNNLECTFEAIYVLPAWRSQGIGDQLVNYSESWAINDKRVNRLKANIYSNNKASEGLHIKRSFTPYNIEYIRRIS